MELQINKYDNYVNIETLPDLSNSEQNLVKIRNDNQMFNKIMDLIYTKHTSMYVETDEGDKLIIAHMDKPDERVYVEKEHTGTINLFNANRELVLSISSSIINVTEKAHEFFLKAKDKNADICYKKYPFDISTYPPKDTRKYSGINTLRYATMVNNNIIFIELNSTLTIAAVKDKHTSYVLNADGKIIDDDSTEVNTYKTGISVNDATNQMKEHITAFIVTVRNLCEVGSKEHVIQGANTDIVNQMTAGDALRNVYYKENIPETIYWLRSKSRLDPRYGNYIHHFFNTGEGTVATTRKHMIYALCTVQALCDNADNLRYMDTLSESLTKALSE